MCSGCGYDMSRLPCWCTHVVIERKHFSHCCAQMQPTTLTRLACYDLTLVYVANMRTWLNIATGTLFMHSDVKGGWTRY